MAEQTNQPTIEELQAQLVTLQDKQTENDARINALSDENKKLSEDLNKARELNTKLFLRIPGTEQPGTTETAEEEDSFDKLLDEIIEKRILSKNKQTN